MIWLIVTAMMFTQIIDSGTEMMPIKINREEVIQEISRTAKPFHDYEKELFIEIIEAEAHPSWDLNGYLLLAQSVRNQLESGNYGSSYQEVLTHSGNFTVYSNGRYKRVEITDNSRKAVEMVLNGSNEQNYGQMYFCTVAHLNNNPNGFHAKRTEVIRYENVVFMR